jgi:copper transport protein
VPGPSAMRRPWVRATALRASAVAAILAVAWLAVLTPAAGAHALLVNSVPADNASLASSPQRLLLTFSESPDPKLSHIAILDSSAHAIAGLSALRAVPGNSLQWQVTLARPLPQGWYTVTWQTVSALDGHFANGLFVFGVGVTPPKVSPFGVVQGHTAMSLTALSAVGRWLLYCGLALMVGADSTCLIALKGRLPAGSRVILRGAWLLSVVGLFVMALTEQHIVGAPSLLPFLQTQTGRAYLILGGVVLGACSLAVVLLGLYPRRATLWGIGAVGAAAMFVHAQAGHGNASSSLRPLHLFEQWLHMVAVGAWIGGLVWLLLALRDRDGLDRSQAVRTFSRMAGYGLAVVVITGLLRAYTEVGSFHALLTTSYGDALLIKVGLACLIVGLAALNRYRFVPALGLDSAAVRTLRRTVGGEVLLAGGILATTAVLVALAPAAFASLTGGGRATGLTASGSDYAATVQVRLSVTPGQVGSNTFEAQVNNYGSSTPAPARSVQLQFTLPAHPELGSATLSRTKQANGVWQASGTALAISGRGTIDVVVQGAANAVDVPLTVGVTASRSP